MLVNIQILQRDFDGSTRKIYRKRQLECIHGRKYLDLYDISKILAYNDIRVRSARYMCTDGSEHVEIPTNGKNIALKGGKRIKFDPLYDYERRSLISFRSINRLFNCCISYCPAKKLITIRQPGRFFVTMEGDTIAKLAYYFNTTRKRVLAFNKGLKEPICPNTRIVIPTVFNTEGGSLASISENEEVKLTPEKANAIITYGLKFLGTPYQFGAAPYPKSGKFDCSSFTQYIFGKNGISLPRTSRQQSLLGTPVAKADLRRGDLLFFSSPRYSDNRVGHVGIHLGKVRMLTTFAPQGVLVRNWKKTSWNKKYLRAMRIPG